MSYKLDVEAEGAIRDSDITESEGFVRKISAGNYEAIKTNLTAIVNPFITDDSAAGYAIGSRWINTATDEEFVCLNAAPFGAVWKSTTSGTGGTSDHGVLIGLGDDDRPQYLLVDGTRAMFGDLNMDGYDIVNVGLINGIDLTFHAPRHESGGADELDGDHLDIDFNPTVYTPDSGIPEAIDGYSLSAHLKGIDNALSSLGGGGAEWTQIGDPGLLHPADGAGQSVVVGAVTMSGGGENHRVVGRSRIDGTRPVLEIQDTVGGGPFAIGRVAQFVTDATYLSSNISFDGITWALDDPLKNGWQVFLDTSTNNGGFRVIHTPPGTSTLENVFAIQGGAGAGAAGKIGMGTTAPGTNLHIRRNTVSNIGLRLDNSAVGGRAYQWLSTGSADLSGVGNFRLHDASGGGGYRLTVDSSGAIIIGSGFTLAGTELLHVAGSILVNDLISGVHGGNAPGSKLVIRSNQSGEPNSSGGVYITPEDTSRVGIGVPVAAAIGAELHVLDADGSAGILVESGGGGSTSRVNLENVNNNTWSITNDFTDEFSIDFGATEIITIDSSNVTVKDRNFEVADSLATVLAKIFSDDGYAVFGGSAMSGAGEQFRVIGNSQFDGLVGVDGGAVGGDIISVTSLSSRVGITGTSPTGVGGVALTANSVTWHLDNRGTADLPNNRFAIFAPGILERFTILTDGSVGIGVTDPQALLHVDGYALFDNDVTIDGKLTVTGAIDPISVTIDDIISGTGAFYEAAGGSTADVSNPNEGRLRYNEVTNKWQISENTGPYTNLDGGGALTGNQSAVQARRTTTYLVGATFADITLDTTDIETDATVIEHDNTNTERILIKETGLHMLTYDCSIDSNNFDLKELRVFKNGITEIPGSRRGLEEDELNAIGHACYAELTAGDYVTLQAQRVGGTVNIVADLIFTVALAKGQKGEQGIPGSGSTITLRDEGIDVLNTPHSVLNFVGAGVTVTDAGAGVATITIPNAGDVVGPAGATDNAIVRYDGATGKLIQDSSVIVTDAGQIAIGSPATPTGPLHIKADGSNRIMRLEENGGTEFMDVGMSSSGDLEITTDSGRLALIITYSSTDERDGNIGMGGDPSDITFYITRDQDSLLEHRLDNTNSGTNIDHTGYSLYDGGTLGSFWRYNNFSNVASFGADEGSGELGLYSGGSEQVRINSSGDVIIGANVTNGTELLRVVGGAVLFDGAIGGTPVSGGSTRLMWIPFKAAFRAGETSGTDWDDANIGTNSVGLGRDTKASGNQTLATGQSTTASGNHSTAMGLESVAAFKGQVAHASGSFGADGDAQTSVLTARKTTSNEIPTDLFLDGSSSFFTLSDSSTYGLVVTVIGRRADGLNESAMYVLRACADRNSGVSALVGSIDKSVIAEDNAPWDANILIGATGADELNVRVIGEAGKTIAWVARIEVTQITI